ncbi:unnamed protein product [Chrysoparadoxa australica]
MNRALLLSLFVANARSFCPPVISSRGISTTLNMASHHSLVMDAFAIRQFTDPNYTGTKVEYDSVEFEAKVNELHEAGAELVDGYAPFCKHVFVPNFAGVKGSIVRITPENEKLLKSGYEARKEGELPVLIRWFPKESVPVEEAKYLDIILYSREQIQKENEAMGETGKPDETAPWGIISVKAQDIDVEIPMQPITMLRNALGVKEGGSGVPLDAEKYAASVDFWKDHAITK